MSTAPDAVPWGKPAGEHSDSDGGAAAPTTAPLAKKKAKRRKAAPRAREQERGGGGASDHGSEEEEEEEASRRAADVAHFPSAAQREAGGECHELIEATMQCRVKEVQRLLKQRVDPNIKAKQPRTTPLYEAVKIQHIDLAHMLLKAKANPNTVVWDRAAAEGSGACRGTLTSTALEEAIEGGYNKIVTLLLAEGADLERGAGGDDIRETTSGVKFRNARTLLFNRGNAITIAAAASGLKEAQPDTLQKNLTPKLLVQFLKSDGRGPFLILEAIFKFCPLSYHDGENWIDVDAAVLDRSAISVALGPDIKVLEDTKLESDREKTREVEEFVKRLAPQPPRDGAEEAEESAAPAFSVLGAAVQALCHCVGSIGSKHDFRCGPVRCYQCVLKGIHTDADVLEAIANTECPAIFDNSGCKAILRLAWSEYRKAARMNILVQTLNLFWLSGMTLSLNDELLFHDLPLEMWIWLCLVSWTYDCVLEFGQAVGYCKWDWGIKQMGLGNLIDFVRLVMRGAAQVSIFYYGRDAGHMLRVLLALTIFHAWMRVLYSLRVFKQVGVKMLPILHAMEDISAILLVVIFYVLGFTHMYFTIGLYDVWDSFMIVFRLAMLGDFDLEEMEDADGQVTKWRLVVRLFLIVVGGLMTITILNIFIGVLSISYETNLNDAERLFRRDRARMILDYKARREGVQHILGYKRCHKARRRGDEFGFVWYCLFTDLEGMDDEEEVEPVGQMVKDLSAKMDRMIEHMKVPEADARVGRE